VASTHKVGSTALVATDRAARYGKQLAAHLGRRLETSWDDESASGVVLFDSGRCDLTSSADGLLLRVEVDSATEAAAALEQLTRMEDVVGRHLVRFGARDELVATWVRF
jgi:hypothetical protein